MNTQKIDIKVATQKQLLMFARASLGLELKDDASRDEILALMASTWQQPHIVVSMPDRGPQTAMPAKIKIKKKTMSKVKNFSDAPKITIRIPEQDRPGGKRPVEVSVNGITMLIPRNQDCEIPYPYYEALKNAVQKTYTQNPDGGDEISSESPNYPFTIVRMANPEHLHKWMEEMGALPLADDDDEEEQGDEEQAA